MSRYEQKIVQYLEEAHATEVALTRVLQSQVAMTPRGRMRTALERHLDETHGHADRVRDRIRALKSGPGVANPLQAWIGLTETIIGQAIALGKTPLDLVRGTGGEEKLLKNAKDDCATEALEIATYTAIERLATEAGDRETAQLAASILADEKRMLDLLLEEIPKLTDAVAKAEIDGRPSFDATTTGAADAVRDVTEAAAESVAKTTDAATRATARTTRRAAKPAARATREAATTTARAATGTSGTNGEAEAPITGYDDLDAAEIVERLPGLSQSELAAVKRYERAHDARPAVLERADSLEEREPWAGYDSADVIEVRARLRDADEDTAKRVREYERRHKGRPGVLESTERVTAGATA